MKKAVFLIGLLCLAAGLFLGWNRLSAGKGAETTGTNDIRVVFVPKLTGNAFFEAANRGAQAYAQKHGFTVDYRGSPQASSENQIAIVKKAIEDRVGAVCVSALDATTLDPVMKEAMAAGIKVVTWDSDVAGDARTLMVSQGTPNQLGTMLVEMGVKSLANRGKSPTENVIRYAWHYSQEIVVDQNSWNVAGEAYIQANYPGWENVAPENYYSHQDPELALSVGRQILSEHPDIDLIICNDSTSLPGQAEAARSMGLSAADVTITGFASPNAMRQYCKDGIVGRWGLWDCRVQGALGCYLAYYLVLGNTPRIGDKIDVPDIGIVTVMPNTVLDTFAYSSPHSGVVLMPTRSEYTIENVDNYDF